MVFKQRVIRRSNVPAVSKKASDLLQSGLISKAFQKLQTGENARRVDINDTTISAIKKLNPMRSVPFTSWQVESSEPSTQLPEILPSHVEKAINSLDAQTNPGLMQFRGEHLQDLIGRKGGQRQGQEFLKHYTSLINLIAKGNELPNEYSQFLSSCQAVPIPKGVNAIRPIAMPHLSRKITEKCLARIYSGQFEKHFQGLQFGVATPSGSEKLVHELLDHQYSNADHDIIVLDSENAFNNQNRDVMFMEIKKYFPELLPYVTSIYNCPNFLFINGDNGKIHTMQSTMGAHQGAPCFTLPDSRK